MVRTRKTSLVFALGVAMSLCAAPRVADGKEPLAACTAAFTKGQEREQAGHLREARESFKACDKAACGATRKKCSAAASRVDASLAFVVPVVLDSSGAPVVDVKLMMDGDVIASRLDGRPIAVEPGVHEVSVLTAGGEGVTQKVMIVQGQHGALSLSIPPPAEKKAPPTPAVVVEREKAPDPEEPRAAPPPEKTAVVTTDAPPRGTSTFAYVLGGVGLAAVGAGALLTYWGRQDNDMLGQCSPNCAGSALTHIRTLYVAADVSFGVGALAIGGAIWLFARGTRAEPTTARAAAFGLDVHPTPAGGLVTLEGRL